MTKNNYIKPKTQVVQLMQRNYLLTTASVQTTGLKDNDNDPDLTYDKNGGDQTYAW